MTLDLVHFTPLAAALGGMLIGFSASWLLLVHGRIAGISGLLGSVVGRLAGSNDAGSRLPVTVAFLAGLAAAPWLFALFGHPVPIHVEAGKVTVLLAGLLVGVGTRFAGGCTSGHGVCGLSNRSRRSLVATLTFMLAAFVTVGVQRWLA